MAEEGTVVAVRPGEVDVLLSGSSACAGCQACAASAGGMLMEHVPVDREVRIGDRVAIEVAPLATSRARALIFGVPVAAVLVGYLAGYLLGGVVGVAQDSAGAVGAISGIVAVLFIFPYYDRSRAEKRSGDVRVHAIISQVMPAGSDAPAPNEDRPGLGGQDS